MSFYVTKHDERKIFYEADMSFKVKIHDVHKIFYVVDWPQTPEMIKHIKSVDLFEVMFRTVRSNYAGLAIKHNNNEYDIMWVNSSIWFDRKNYTEYIRDMYEVIGLAFEDEAEANICAEVMNKTLMWEILNGNHKLTV